MSARRGDLFGTPAKLGRESVTRSDIADFAATVSGLSEQKVAAVIALGWDSLLHIGCPRLVNPIWRVMFNGTDVANCSVSVMNHRFELNGSSFGRHIGICDGGSDFELGCATDPSEFELGCATDPSELCDDQGKTTVSRLKEIVQNREEADDLFKIAYCLLALTQVLCPTISGDVDLSLLQPLLETEHIRGKNWASFCVSRLLESVTSHRESGDHHVAGCLLYLQILYLDYVGPHCGIYADSAVIPLKAWGQTEVRGVVSRLSELGGVKSPVEVLEKNKRVRTVTQSASDNNGSPGFAIRQSVHEDIFELKIEMGGVKNQVSSLSEELAKIQPDLAVLSSSVEVAVKQLARLREECAQMVKAQVVSNSGGKGCGCCQTMQTPPKRCRGGITGLGDADWLLENSDGGGQELGKATKAASATSSSPGAPVEKTKRPEKDGSFWQPAHARPLFSYAVEKKGDEDRRTHHGPLGPYKGLMLPLSSEETLLINYALEEKLTEAEGRVLVASAGNGRETLTRKEISHLGPKEKLDSYIINNVARASDSKDGREWVFPTYFSEKALSDGKTNVGLWVEETRMVCNMERWEGKLPQCEKMFIPMHDGSTEGHWVLGVVRMDTREVEIWDSAPYIVSRTVRWERVSKMLKHLDRCFYYEKLRMPGKRFDFAYFPQIEPKGVAKQSNGYDCGLHLACNVTDYGTNWHMKGGSNEHRARLLLRCLRAPMNEIASRTLEDARAWAAQKAAGNSGHRITTGHMFAGGDLFDIEELDGALAPNGCLGDGGFPSAMFRK